MSERKHKLPGKRDRLRKASQPSLPAAASEPAPAAPAPPTSAPVVEDWGPWPALLPARVLHSTGGRLALAYLAVAFAFNMAQPRKTAPTPPPYDPPLEVDHPDPEIPAPPLADVPRLAVPPPEDQPPEPGDGSELVAQALALAPPLPHSVARDLKKAARDPDAYVPVPTLAWVREQAPALDVLERASRCESFQAGLARGPVDWDKLLVLSAASLCVGRYETRGGAPGRGAKPALDLLRLGHGMARTAPVLLAASALSLARVAERWLSHSLERDVWSREELTWLHGRLAVIADRRRGSGSVVAAARPALPSDPLLEAERVDADERRELEALLALVKAKLDPASAQESTKGAPK